jgi:predicted Co/Zn/Cd cation transporter (cation efflux family)
MQINNLIEEKALKKSMVGAILLAVWGITMAIVASSSAIMLDGMFNLISGIMSYFFIQIARLTSDKATREYPLGYYAYESLLVFIKGATILLLIVMAVYSNLMILLSGGKEPQLGLMMLYVAVAVFGCLALFLISRAAFKKTGSELLHAETRAWLINAAISAAIGLALAITMLLIGTSLAWIARYIDQILVIILSLAFIKDPLVFMKNGLRELVLAAPHQEYTTPFENKFLPLKDQLGAKELDLEIMKTGRRMWVTVRLTPADDTIRMPELKKARDRLSEIAKEIYADTQVELILETG